MGAESAPFILSRVKNEEINRENFCPEDISNIGDAGLKEFYFKQVSRSTHISKENKTFRKVPFIS